MITKKLMSKEKQKLPEVPEVSRLVGSGGSMVEKIFGNDMF